MLWIAIFLSVVVLAVGLGAVYMLNLKNRLKTEGKIGHASVIDSYVDPSNLHDPRGVVKYRFIHPKTNKAIKGTACLPLGTPLPAAGYAVKVVYLPETDLAHEIYDEYTSLPNRRAA